MTKNDTPAMREYEYKAEMKQLLELIVHSLYTHPEIFLRELISNASDALSKVRFNSLTDESIMNSEAGLAIRITLDSEAHTVVIEDNGTGMTEEELILNLGTVARSGTLGFLQALKEQQKELDGNLIGQFGVGFYSVFMVTDEVTVETRSSGADSAGYRWRSGAAGTFTIERIEKEQRGTRISFTLKEEFREFSETYRIEQIIRKYSNFVDFPIFLGDNQINTISALWQRSKNDVSDEERNEFYKFLSNDFNPPLDTLHLSVEGKVCFKALLFLPEEAPPELMYRQGDLESRGPQLYVKKVLIQQECRDLLPEYLRFVAGVVDTEDLPLNVSREVVQSSKVMANIRQILTGKILSWFESMATDQPEKFRKFYKAFGPFLKIGLNTDFTHRDRIIGLMRFESTKTAEGEYVTFKEYVERMDAGQNEIYYHSGSHRSQLLAHPNLEYFQHKGIEVLLLSDPVDVFVIPSIHEFDKKPLKSIEKADIDFTRTGDDKTESPLPETLSQPLLGLFRQTIGDVIEDVVESHRLVSSPVTLVSGKDSLDSSMEKMMKMMHAEMPAAKKILEVNTSHPIIKNLSGMIMANEHNPLIRTVIQQLYDGALLHEGNLDATTGFLQRMNELIEAATMSR
jgi:molecular chaperone HtpG